MFLRNLMKLRPESSILLAMAAVVGTSVACEPADDSSTLPPPFDSGAVVATGGVDSGAATTGGIDSGAATTGGIDSGAATTGGTSTTGGTTDSGSAGGTGADGAAPAGDAGATDSGAVGPTMVKNFPGKYMGCQSFTAAMGMGEAKKCTSWQCNVTLGELRTAYVMGAGKCANRPVEDICDNKIPIDVGSCARQMKTANVFDTNAQLRPKVIDCVRKVNPTEYSEAKLTTDCLNCFVDVADCAGEKCLFECLDTDNADCDACRIRNKCDQNVFTCGGLPNTF